MASTELGTISGRFIDPATLRPEQINVWDIAWSLSQQNRYGGHSPVPWSVLSHTGLVMQLYLHDVKGEVDSELFGQLALHDAAEAYCMDVVRPIKNRPEMQFFRDLEDRVLRVVFERFGYSFPDPQEWADKIERYDWQAICVEYYQFKPYLRGTERMPSPTYPLGDWTTRPLVVAKPQDYVDFLKEQCLIRQKTSDIDGLFSLPESMQGLVVTPTTQTEAAPDALQALNDRIPMEQDPVLRMT